jgi:hypothetical protein
MRDSSGPPATEALLGRRQDVTVRGMNEGQFACVWRTVEGTNAVRRMGPARNRPRRWGVTPMIGN